MNQTRNPNSNQNGIKDPKIRKGTLVWNKKSSKEIGLVRFQKLIERKYNEHFDSYWDFHKWTIKNCPLLWKELWDFFNFTVSKPYDKVYVKTGTGILESKWFTELTFNVAENILRIRDDTVALMYADELGNKGEMTFNEIFEEVKIYAAAFRKHGVGVGDRIAGYISNTKEAFFAFLAAVSIGAIWGAAMPYLGPKAASNIMKVMNPKVIISVDHFHAGEEEFYPIENLPTIAEGISNLEKVVIVSTENEARSRDISNIPKSVWLGEFLERGRNPDGSVPDLVFEQLPSSHPFMINFTSGTTGIPKGVTHSVVAFLGFMRDFIIHLDLKSGDVAFNNSPVGWAIWVYPFPGLAIGVKQFLFNGSAACNTNGQNIWDHIAENKVAYVFMASADLDDVEEKGIVPGPNTNLDCFKIISLSGSPPKPRNYEFLLTKVKRDLFVGCMYGASETMGTFSGYNLNMPALACECQVPALGVDLHCYDEQSKSVVGQRGELVVTSPSPSLPIYLWGDKDNTRMHEAYFSKYGKEVWCQNDEGYFNPITKGYSVLGRSDNALKQWGERLSPDDIYIAIDHMEELQDFICICQDSLTKEPRSVLFVKLNEGYSYTSQLKEKIERNIQNELSLVSVPQVILEVPDIPYNITHKRMESTVKKIVMTNCIPVVMNIENPECLKYFCDIPELMNY